MSLINYQFHWETRRILVQCLGLTSNDCINPYDFSIHIYMLGNMWYLEYLTEGTYVTKCRKSDHWL